MQVRQWLRRGRQGASRMEGNHARLSGTLSMLNTQPGIRSIVIESVCRLKHVSYQSDSAERG
jgi:hypothetical protein